MRKKRETETPEDRQGRLSRNAEQRAETKAADDDAIHAMIKHNLEERGP